MAELKWRRRASSVNKPEESKTMTGIQDRVIFWPNGTSGLPSEPFIEPYTKQQEATMRALRAALGFSRSHAKTIMAEHKGIICRPAQFARFVIARPIFGGQNLMHRIQPKLLWLYDAKEATKYTKIVDWSGVSHAPIGCGIYSRPALDNEAYGVPKHDKDAPPPEGNWPYLEVEKGPDRVFLHEGDRYRINTGSIVRVKTDSILLGAERERWLSLKPVLQVD
jgi:hypothetical protein